MDSVSLLFWICLVFAHLAASLDYTDDSDLAVFVSRPDLRPARFVVTVHDPGAVTPGYWFITPYTELRQDPWTKKFQPCQVGPHIYDNDGNLVWSGACLFPNRNMYDFKVIPDAEDPSKSNLSVILGPVPEHTDQMKGAGLILSSSFEIIEQVPASRNTREFNMHEFNLIDHGRRALLIISEAQLLDVSELNLPLKTAWVENQGFQMIDIATRHVLFEWWALDHVELRESKESFPTTSGSPVRSWDYLHINSVEQSPEGDYLISARHTNTIYLISGTNGSILWRLGGEKSDFVFDQDPSFVFSAQHDARFHPNYLSSAFANDDVDATTSSTIISLLDNAAASLRYIDKTSNTSSALLLHLETQTTPKTARILRRYYRPDGRISYRRGNAQFLPSSDPESKADGNVFVFWSDDDCYLSEFTPSGRCVLEARFLSPRLSAYRAFKFNFTGQPIEAPILKAYVFGAAGADGVTSATTVWYVSWNGATEVRSWRFYSGVKQGQGRNGAQYGQDGAPELEQVTLVGSCAKVGFETQFMAGGYAAWSYAEAIADDGRVLGKSVVVETILPQQSDGFPGNEMAQPNPSTSVDGSNSAVHVGAHGIQSCFWVSNDPEGICSDVRVTEHATGWLIIASGCSFLFIFS